MTEIPNMDKTIEYEIEKLDKFSILNYIRRYELFGLEGPDCVLYFSTKTKKQILPFESGNSVLTIKPDIIIWNHVKSPIVIEIKNGIQKVNELEERKKSLYYKINHISSIIIDKNQLKLIKTSWKQYIDSELARLNII